MASEYNKSVSGTNSVNLSNVSFNTSNIAGYNKKVGSNSNSSGSSSRTTSITINLDDLLTDNLEEGVTSEKIADPKQYNTDDKKGFWGKVGDMLTSVGATIAVGTTSVLSGVLDIVEGLGDGVVWVASKAVGIVSPDAEEAMKEFIARDLVTEANEWLYEETEFGRAINDASYMKYDSDTAQGIRSVTTTVTEIAAATALTVATGGAAAPFVVGAAVGLGEAAESTYKTNGTNTTLMQELGIGFSGVLNGLSWMANGKLGQGALNILKDSAALGFKNVVSGILKEMTSWDFWKNALKEGLSLKNAKGKLNFNALINYLTSAFGTAGTLTPYITGEEEFDETAALKLVGTYASYLGLNLLEDIFRDKISSYSTADILGLTEGNASILPSGQEILTETLDESTKFAIESDAMNTPETIKVFGETADLKTEALATATIQTSLSENVVRFLDDFAKDPDVTPPYGIPQEIIEYLNQYAKNPDTTLPMGVPPQIVEYLNLKSLEIKVENLDDSVGQDLLNFAQRYSVPQNYYYTDEGKRLLDIMEQLKDVSYENFNSRFPGLFRDEYDYLDTLSSILSSKNRCIAITILNNGEIFSSEQFDDIQKYLLDRSSFSNVNMDSITYLRRIVEDSGYTINPRYQSVYEQLCKKLDLTDAENIIRSRLAAFSGSYVSSEKTNSILGSFELEVDSDFATRTTNPLWAGFNNGTRSVINLKYSIAELEDIMNHESVHQISHNSNVNYDMYTGERISLSGVQRSVFRNGSWQSVRTGMNESITEFFNIISHGENYNKSFTSGYQAGVDAIESFVENGIISIEDLKKFYFTNNGEGLIKYFDDITSKYGLSISGEDISKAFDEAALNEGNTAKGMKILNQYIKEFQIAISGGDISKSTNILSKLKELLGL